jgi:hypothetical protein
MHMLEESVTDDMILEIAAEYRKGRILSIETTDLDPDERARRPGRSAV